VAANYYLGTACFVAGDYRRTDEFFPRILQLLEGDRVRERCGLAGFPVVMSRMFWTLALAERGEFDRALTEAQEGVLLAETLDHPYSLACALRGLGRPYLARGDLDRATRFTERAVALSRERHIPQIWPEMADQLGYAYALSGRVADGLSMLEEALTALESMGMFQWRTPLLAHLAETYLLASRFEDALTIADRGLALSRERGHRGSEAWTLRLLGDISAHGESPGVAAAEAHYGAAIALASELGMRPLVAHCHLGLGRLHRRAYGPTKAERHLATAGAMYREMGMSFWLEKMETEPAPTREAPRP
jgi:tetratricopeptide (TPR) repeat protein